MAESKAEELVFNPTITDEKFKDDLRKLSEDKIMWKVLGELGLLEGVVV